VGNQVNAGAWTLLGVANGWVATGGTNVQIPINISHFLCAGDVGGFYITANNSTNGNYSNGTGVGNVAAADANIQILEGTGKAYAFGASYQPRVPNVTVMYTCAISCCLPPTMSEIPETCVGSCDGSATATVGAGGIAPYSYIWYDNAMNPIGQTTMTATNLCAGTYNVQVTDNTGCVSVGVIVVTSGAVSADATITAVANVCPGDPAFNFVGADPGGTWSGTGISNTTTGAFDPLLAGPGTYTITYTIAGACGDVQTTSITVDPYLDATITAAGPFCAGDVPVTLAAFDPGGTWSGSGITNTATGAFDPGAATIGVNTITYTIPGGCGDVQTTNITVNANFSAVITPEGPFCPGDPSIIMQAVDGGGTWSGTGITNGATGAFDPSTAGPGTHTITYTIAGACGDVQTTTITIKIFIHIPIHIITIISKIITTTTTII